MSGSTCGPVLNCVANGSFLGRRPDQRAAGIETTVQRIGGQFEPIGPSQRAILNEDAREVSRIETGYETWERGKIERRLAEGRDGSVMIPIEQVWRDQGFRVDLSPQARGA